MSHGTTRHRSRCPGRSTGPDLRSGSGSACTETWTARRTTTRWRTGRGSSRDCSLRDDVLARGREIVRVVAGGVRPRCRSATNRSSGAVSSAPGQQALDAGDRLHRAPSVHQLVSQVDLVVGHPPVQIRHPAPSSSTTALAPMSSPIGTVRSCRATGRLVPIPLDTVRTDVRRPRPRHRSLAVHSSRELDTGRPQDVGPSTPQAHQARVRAHGERNPRPCAQ